MSARAVGGADMSDDEFDFSDHDLDDLPANTIEQFEAAAIRATQQPQTQRAESNYGLDDGDEVVNLDDDAAGYAQGQQGRGHDPYDTHDANDAYDEGTTIDESNRYEFVQTAEPPRRSQADPDQLLSRIRKVGSHVAAVVGSFTDRCS
jgi:hypothetical protein